MKMKRLTNSLQTIKQRQRNRKQLLKLPDAMLKDIDVSRVEANKEGRKRFWQ